MIYTPLTRKALRLCYEAHKDQKDKSGVPYVFHPFHLAEQMPDEITTITALLHDTVEDTWVTPDYLRREGFPEEAVRAVERMTHPGGVPYMDYVRDLKQDPVARTVKLADLRHNSDLSRLDAVSREDLRRADKYRRAIELLEKQEE